MTDDWGNPTDPSCGEGDPEDGPPDPQLDPTRSPGFGEEPAGLEDIEVSRADVTIGEADPEELTAADTDPVLGAEERELLADLADGDVVDRRRAALALAEGDASEAALAGLEAAALGDDDADVRQFAVEALGKLGGRRAGRVGAELTDDPDPWVRAEAYVALDRIDRETYADVIEEGLADDHHAARRNAAISLFKREGEGARETLLAQADDDSERVREWAAHLLGGVTGPEVEETLRRLAGEDDSQVVRQTAARALEADAGRFRRQFTGALDERDTTLPGEDMLNRRPDL